MKANKCFSNSNKCESSSDYTKINKQKTIFKDVVNQVQTNFIKSNNVNYNENFVLHNNCLAFSKSYELLLDVTKGRHYAAPVTDPAWTSNEAWSAGLYSVNYSANGVNVVVDTSYNAGNANQIIAGGRAWFDTHPRGPPGQPAEPRPADGLQRQFVFTPVTHHRLRQRGDVRNLFERRWQRLRTFAPTLEGVPIGIRPRPLRVRG